MRIEVVTLGIFLGLAFPALKAGSVVTLSEAPETDGKLSFVSGAIQVESASSPASVNFSDVLEADFSDAPFHLDAFSSIGSTATALPPDWKAQDLGPAEPPSFVSYAGGAFTLTGAAVELIRGEPSNVDKFYYVGRPWSGNGQWTARLREINAQTPQAYGGLMMRQSLDPGSPLVAVQVAENGNTSGTSREQVGRNYRESPSLAMELPLYLRLTRYGAVVDSTISTDGNQWSIVEQDELPDSTPDSWIGFFVRDRKTKTAGTLAFDQVDFMPAPSAAVMVPAGVILQSGSFLAGHFDHLNLDPAAVQDTNGQFHQDGGKEVVIPRAKVAVVTLLPTPRSQLTAAGSQLGLLMRNGDSMTGDFQSIDHDGVHFSSEILGPVVYHTEVLACLVQPLQPQPAPYEVRLRDGSIIWAVSITGDKGQVTVDDASGVAVSVPPEEIAQFRAGSTQVQSLLQFPWKATPPAGAASPGLIANWPSVTTPPPTTNLPPLSPAPTAPSDQIQANPLPAAAPPPEAAPAESWAGNNEEQILAASPGTRVDFSIAGKFRALALHVAVGPGGPPNGQADVRIMADGREIGRTPPFRVTDPPRFIQVALPPCRSVSLLGDSYFPGTKVLFIDPTLILSN